MSNDRTLKFEDIGPIESFEFTCPAEGGIVELRGEQEIGKSTALKTIDSAVRGEGALPLRRGAVAGKFEGLGVTITVGRNTRRSGKLSIVGIDGDGPSVFIDPGIKDPKAADLRRAQALCELLHIEPDPKLFDAAFEKAKLPGRTIISDAAWLARTLPDMAQLVKEELEGKARQSEKDAQILEGEATQLEGSIKGVDLEAPSNEDLLQGDVDEATANRARVLAEIEAAERREEAATTARARVEELRAKAEGKSYEELMELGSRAETGMHAISDHIAKLEQGRRELGALAKEHRSNALQRKHTLELIAEAESILLARDSMPAPAAEEVQDAHERVKRAQAARDLGRDVRKATQQAEIARARRAIQKEVAAKAKQMREAAALCEDVVSTAISKLAPSGIRMKDGRMTITRGEVTEYIADLSDGARANLGARITAAGLPQGRGLFQISQKIYGELQPAKRLELRDVCRELGVVCITGQVTDDPTLTAKIL